MGLAGGKDKRVLWKFLNLLLLILTWHHRVGFKEIFTIGTVLMQLELSEGQARRLGPMGYYTLTPSMAFCPRKAQGHWVLHLI